LRLRSLRRRSPDSKQSIAAVLDERRDEFVHAVTRLMIAMALEAHNGVENATAPATRSASPAASLRPRRIVGSVIPAEGTRGGERRS
jgi:hypothetical protein